MIIYIKIYHKSHHGPYGSNGKDTSLPINTVFSPNSNDTSLMKSLTGYCTVEGLQSSMLQCRCQCRRTSADLEKMVSGAKAVLEKV